MRAVTLVLVALPLLLPGLALAQGTGATASPSPAAMSPSPAPAAQTSGAKSAAASRRGVITCADIPKAQAFVDKLRPGPNTRAAQRYLDAAKSAPSDKQCIADLRKVDVYARRSSEADKRLAAAERHPHRRFVRCADPMHQNLPGGTDYRGPPVAGCPTPRI